MGYQYDKDKIKQELTINQVADFVAELGGEPIMKVLSTPDKLFGASAILAAATLY